MGVLKKTERVLEGNLCNLFAVLVSPCDFDTRNKVEIMTKFPDLEKKQDSIGLLTIIMRLVYTHCTSGMNARYKKAIAHMNLTNLFQDSFQDMQDFRDLQMAMKQVCDELELHFGT